jgi:hypothetical protein
MRNPTQAVSHGLVFVDCSVHQESAEEVGIRPHKHHPLAETKLSVSGYLATDSENSSLTTVEYVARLGLQSVESLVEGFLRYKAGVSEIKMSRAELGRPDAEFSCLCPFWC